MNRPYHFFILDYIKPVETTPSSMDGTIQAFWPFDNSLYNLYGVRNGIEIGSVTYSSKSITSYGSRTIVDLDAKPNSNWCKPILDFTTSGELIAQSIQTGQICYATGSILPVTVWTQCHLCLFCHSSPSLVRQ
ncbi:hypothetical protein I4U23_030241 [Adineta vaga]|nr:hypothetical protein I4U23_030241 [Adineta vaga]